MYEKTLLITDEHVNLIAYNKERIVRVYAKKNFIANRDNISQI